MKKIFTLFILLSSFCLAIARDDRYTNSNLRIKIESMKNAGVVFHPVNVMKFERTSRLESIGDFVVYTINKRELSKVFTEEHKAINFVLPLSNGDYLEIYATINELFTDDFEESETDERGRHPAENKQGLFYHGIINNQNKNSIVCISLFEDELSAVIVDESGNWNFGKLKGGDENEYAYFNDRKFHIPITFQCSSKDDEVLNEKSSEIPQPENVAPIKKCVRVFFDCDKSLYDYLGGVSTTPVSAYIKSLFNVVSTLFGQEDVSVSISAIHYWRTSDPFSGANSTDALDDFEAYYNTFNGDCALLLAHDNNNGGRANVSAICNGYSYNDINAFYSSAALSFPTYTWDANVLTHELGHNFGSKHTHWCGWTGGAIDNCNTCWNPPYAFDGTCTSAPNPPSTGGTIMSYCHGCNEGINFLAGFGTQPGNAIRNFIAGKTCLGNCSNSCQPYVSVGVPITTGNTLIFRSDKITFGSNTVSSGANATFYGGDEIRLNPGFFAQSGCVFLASINQCTPAQYAPGRNAAATANELKKGNIFLSVNPNPTEGEITISIETKSNEAVSLKIYDYTGAEVKRILDDYFIIDSYVQKTEISHLAKGVYFLVLEGNDFRQGVKLVKIN